jgi:site-specific DNA recombinase
VQYVLTNETYAGLARYNRMKRKGKRLKPTSEWIEVPVPAIISPDRYRQTQAQLRRNTFLQPGRRRRTYLLRGIVHCALCGKSLQGAPVRGVPHYACVGKLSPDGCAKRITRAAPLDALVWEAVRRLVEHPEMVAAEVQRQREGHLTHRDEAEMRLAAVRNAIEKIPIERDKILSVYREGWISEAEAKAQLAAAQRKREGLEAERQRLTVWLEGEAADERTRTRLDHVLRRVRNRMDQLTPDERFEVVHTVIRDVRLDNAGAVEITSYLPGPSESNSGSGSDRYHVTSGNMMTDRVNPVEGCGRIGLSRMSTARRGDRGKLGSWPHPIGVISGSRRRGSISLRGLRHWLFE